jgi:hypothetical protein
VPEIVFAIHNDRILAEHTRFTPLYSQFVGLDFDDNVWDVLTYSENHDRFIDADIAAATPERVIVKAESG